VVVVVIGLGGGGGLQALAVKGHPAGLLTNNTPGEGCGNHPPTGLHIS